MKCVGLLEMKSVAVSLPGPLAATVEMRKAKSEKRRQRGSWVVGSVLLSGCGLVSDHLVD
jgi:hypothetical protein